MSVLVDVEPFARALQEASWRAFVAYQRQVAADALRVAVERAELRLFGRDQLKGDLWPNV